MKKIFQIIIIVAVISLIQNMIYSYQIDKIKTGIENIYLKTKQIESDIYDIAGVDSKIGRAHV